MLLLDWCSWCFKGMQIVGKNVSRNPWIFPTSSPLVNHYYIWDGNLFKIMYIFNLHNLSKINLAIGNIFLYLYLIHLCIHVFVLQIKQRGRVYYKLCPIHSRMKVCYIVNEDVLKVSFCEFIIYEHLYF